MNPLGPVLSPLGSAAGHAAAAGIGSVMDSMTQWIAGGAAWFLGKVGAVMTSTTRIDLTASWFGAHYATIAMLAGVVAAPLVFVTTIQAIARQDLSVLTRCILVNLPLALIATGITVEGVQLAVSAVDWMCTIVTSSTHADLTSLFATMEKWFVVGGAASVAVNPVLGAVPGFVAFLLGGVVAFGALALWLEMAVRAAAVYIAVLFLPMAFVATVMPSTIPWCKRLIETLAALIVSKLVIVAALALAVSIVGTSGSALAGVVEGSALLLMSTFAPFAVLKLVPAVEAGAVHHMEGLGRRGLSAPVRTVSEGMNALNGASALPASLGNLAGYLRGAQLVTSGRRGGSGGSGGGPGGPAGGPFPGGPGGSSGPDAGGSGDSIEAARGNGGEPSIEQYLGSGGFRDGADPSSALFGASGGGTRPRAASIRSASFKTRHLRPGESAGALLPAEGSLYSSAGALQ